ncbi:MAG: phosphotransferase [Marinifilaceae bacterium]|nr:phosphotransferase [Marinifilaceae bacterium]
MKKEIKNKIIELYKENIKEEINNIQDIPQSGSERMYIRILSAKSSIIGVYSPDHKESEAFIDFSNQFANKGISVGRVLAVNYDKTLYLTEDLGEYNLFNYICSIRESEDYELQLKELYKNVINSLIDIQIKTKSDFDYTKAYPRKAFDKQSMLWDLNYFKYYFLKLAGIQFNEELLERDFQKFTDFLLSAKSESFMYRDFQSRNIMIGKDKLGFIDYQGGRKGALQYDLASLLFDAKADLSPEIRENLLDYYLDQLESNSSYTRIEFVKYFNSFVLIRIMQAMGAYGFRGFYERKEHFLKSIPFAINNLKYLLQKDKFGVEIPELLNALRKVSESKKLLNIANEQKLKLRVEINSFSYKRGVPVDLSKNGGGYVFDCRHIHNPGRYEQYKLLTGKDQAVIDFFNKENEMETFLSSVYNLVDASVSRYIQRDFSNLQVNFGCTGGRHRSVFAAESLAKHLENKFDINVELKHVERELEENG